MSVYEYIQYLRWIYLIHANLLPQEPRASQLFVYSTYNIVCNASYKIQV